MMHESAALIGDKGLRATVVVSPGFTFVAGKFDDDGSFSVFDG